MIRHLEVGWDLQLANTESSRTQASLCSPQYWHHPQAGPCCGCKSAASSSWSHILLHLEKQSDFPGLSWSPQQASSPISLARVGSYIQTQAICQSEEWDCLSLGYCCGQPPWCIRARTNTQTTVGFPSERRRWDCNDHYSKATTEDFLEEGIFVLGFEE